MKCHFSSWWRTTSSPMDLISQEMKRRLINSLSHWLTHRSHILWRSFTLVNMKSPDNALSISRPIRASNRIGLVVVFTGQGVQYASIGFELLRYKVWI
ncbi:hypothetical protein F4677DRAFT_293304 [Hypoxylon crocopeplum]|nr:hypothetical protein F4677DRAFT_293304 [Hypoxylon crocopeplum]